MSFSGYLKVVHIFYMPFCIDDLASLFQICEFDIDGTIRLWSCVGKPSTHSINDNKMGLYTILQCTVIRGDHSDHNIIFLLSICFAVSKLHRKVRPALCIPNNRFRGRSVRVQPGTFDDDQGSRVHTLGHAWSAADNQPTNQPQSEQPRGLQTRHFVVGSRTLLRRHNNA